MVNINLVTALASLQPRLLESPRLVSVPRFPQMIPPIFIRETLPADLPYLLEVGHSVNFYTLNFPADPSRMESKIARSTSSFSGERDPIHQEMMFSLLAKTHDGPYIPIGTSTFFPHHGTPDKPHHAYQVIRSTRARANGGYEDDSLLHLVQSHEGPAEVGAVVIHAQATGLKHPKDFPFVVEGVEHMVRGDVGVGRIASWVRFFFAAMPSRRSAYAARSCLTEILPPFISLPDGNRSNAFYESHARRYFDGRPYDEIDLLTNDDRSLITAKLPKVVPFSELSPEARAIIGVARPESRGALHLLEKLGFKPTHQVDPIDAGPHYLGAFSENPIFMGARDVHFAGTSGREEIMPWHFGLIGRERQGREGPRFLAALGAFFLLGDELYTTRTISEFLGLEVGRDDGVTVSPL